VKSRILNYIYEGWLKAQGKQQSLASSILPYALRLAPYAFCIRRKRKPAENDGQREKSHFWMETARV
jgi:hypothetical protein